MILFLYPRDLSEVFVTGEVNIARPAFFTLLMSLVVSKSSNIAFSTSGVAHKSRVLKDPTLIQIDIYPP
jgi:hypothetical protein